MWLFLAEEAAGMRTSSVSTDVSLLLTLKKSQVADLVFNCPWIAYLVVAFMRHLPTGNTIYRSNLNFIQFI